MTQESQIIENQLYGDSVEGPIKDFEVCRIPHRIAKAFIVRWHYSHSCPTGLNIFFGAFLAGELYAVADYGMGSNMDKGAALARRTGLPVRFQTVTQKWLDAPHKNMNVEGLTIGPYNCLELKRLCRQGERGVAKIPLTRFLAICHQFLRCDGIRFIVSYSDPGELKAVKVESWETPGQYRSQDGLWHIPLPEPKPHPKTGLVKQDAGHIYRAANFQYLGRTVPEAHTVNTNTGEVVHRRVAFKEKNRWNAKHPDRPKTIGDVRKEHGRVPILTPPKERWFIDLGFPRQRQQRPSNDAVIPQQERLTGL